MRSGDAYGMAFQIRDDVAGIWSSVDETGKTVASDIARRKLTFPVVWALAQPSSPARAIIADAYASEEPLDDGRVERIVDALDAIGARQAATEAAAEHRAVLENHTNVELREYLSSTLGLTAAR